MKEICIFTLILSHTLIYGKKYRIIFFPGLFLCVCTNIGFNTWHKISVHVNRRH